MSRQIRQCRLKNMDFGAILFVSIGKSCRRSHGNYDAFFCQRVGVLPLAAIKASFQSKRLLITSLVAYAFILTCLPAHQNCTRKKAPGRPKIHGPAEQAENARTGTQGLH